MASARGRTRNVALQLGRRDGRVRETLQEVGLRSWIEVSRHRLRENFRAIRSLVGAGVEVMPVVKADAYRHGAVEVSRLLEAEGASWLAVSNVEEGVVLRQAGIASRLLVMADFLAEERSALEEFHLTPVIHTLGDVRAATVPYHLKIDSGMGRLGTRASVEEIVAAVRSVRAPLEGLMTHFASAANYESPQTDEQMARFAQVLHALTAPGLEPAYIHQASTISVAYRRERAWGNLVRPGHAIYGYVSPAKGAASRALDVRPALTWKATVLAVKDLDAGAPIGYGAIHRATKPTRIALVAAGYAHALPHR